LKKSFSSINYSNPQEELIPKRVLYFSDRAKKVIPSAVNITQIQEKYYKYRKLKYHALKQL